MAGCAVSEHDDGTQLSFLDERSRTITRRANAISKRASKARRSLPVLQPELIADDRYLPVRGVPAMRAECPTQRPCPHMCRYNLLIEDADTRAGRPGLSSVPRDARGLTLPVEGHAGNERPGTTLRPSWLTYRGLEVEREVKVYIDIEGNVMSLRAGALEYWLDRLHIGEPVLVFNDDDASLLAKGKLTADGLALDREIPASVLGSSSAIVLTRVRGVSSCALDEIDRRGKHTNEQVGDAIGRHRTLAARIVPKAFKKAKQVAAEMFGMSEEDLLRGLRELGAGG